MKILTHYRSYSCLWLLSAFCLTACWSGPAYCQEVDPAEVVPEEQKEESLNSLRQKANMLRQSEQWEEAVKTYREIVERDPESSVDWHLLGYCLHGTDEIDKAIAAHKIAAKSDQYKPISLYNLGCAYSLKDDADKSFDYLRQAIDAGFNEMSYLETDSDLDNIRKDEARFKKLLAYASGEEVDEEDSDDESDNKKSPLIGNWKMVSGTKGGAESTRMPAAIKISDDAFTIPSEQGGEPFVMSYKIDMSKTPHTIDFNIESGPIPQGQAIGILKLKEDKLTLVYDPTGQNRPEKFESTEENGFLMFVMKKLPKGVDPEVNKKLIGTWVIKSGMRSGSEVAEERMEGNIEIDEETITIPGATDDETFVIGYKIDASKSPMQIDMAIESGPAPEGAPAIGIIKMGDGEFKLCYDAEGGARPEKFESTEENGYFMFKLKKLEID